MLLLSDPVSLDIIGNELNNHFYDFKRRMTKGPIKTNLGCKDYNGGIYLSESDDFVVWVLWHRNLPNLCPLNHL